MTWTRFKWRIAVGIAVPLDLWASNWIYRVKRLDERARCEEVES